MRDRPRVIPILIFMTVFALFAPLELLADRSALEVGRGKEVLASVGDDVLLLSDFRKMLSALPAEQRDKLTPDKQKTLVEDWILTRLLSAEAERNGIAKRAHVQSALRKSRMDVLSKEMLRDITSGIVVTKDDVASYFEAHKELFAVPETVHLHILTVGTHEEAEAALARIGAGEDFAAVAKDVSTDKFKDSGGDVGVIPKSEKLPEYLRVAFYLRAGSTSDAIRCKDGYCVLKVTEKSPSRNLSFDELTPKLKAMIENKALRVKQAKAVIEARMRLEKKTGVQRHLDLLGASEK